jgi:hypothetical protein
MFLGKVVLGRVLRGSVELPFVGVHLFPMRTNTGGSNYTSRYLVTALKMIGAMLPLPHTSPWPN